MKIASKTVVTLQYRVSDPDGATIDEGGEPMVYVQGGRDVDRGLFPKLQQALEGLSAGDEKKVTLEPLEAFGDYDAELVLLEPKDAFPDEIEVGTILEREDDDGEMTLFRVAEIRENTVVVDGNHPLAGVSLVFECKIIDVRSASDEEFESSTPEV